MPDLDLDMLKASQSEAGRARLSLDKAQAALAQARERLNAETAALTRAEAAGDARAISHARRQIEASTARMDQLTRDKAELAKTFRDKLDRFLKLPLDAPGDVPLLLLPLRLETRFGKTPAGKPVLRIRAYPDDIHIDATDPGLSRDEITAATAYWSNLFAAKDDSEIAVHWGQLLDQVGKGRARFVARAMRPINATERGTGAAPKFPTPHAPVKGAARPRLLPERLLVTAWQQGQQLRAAGGPIASDLAIGLIADDGSGISDHDGLKMLDGTEWLADFDLALQAGMALELPLRTTAPIERLYVYGVSASRTPGECAAALDALLAAHDGGAGLAFVPQGTPTNNTEAADAGWQRWDTPAALTLTDAPLAPDSVGRLTAAALGSGGAVLASIPHAEAIEDGAAQAMNAALWPATWGYFLETLDESQSKLSPWLIDEISRFHRGFLRGRGALPAIRVGNQPYGIFPFTGFTRAATAAQGATETALDKMLRKMLPNWLNATRNLPRLDQGGGAQKVLEIYGHAPVSWGVRARRCLSGDLIRKIEATTTTGKDAADVEALLVRLVAEALGGFNYVYGPGSLDEESRPVLLPYADPARDAAYAQSLIDGRSGGGISSIFQALIALGWARVNRAATPPKRFAEAVNLTNSISPELSQRVIGLAMSPIDNPSAEQLRAVLTPLRLLAERADATAPLDAPLRLQRDRASMVLDATSIAEREAYGIAMATDLLIGVQQRSAMQEGLARLAAMGGDFSILVAETLDTCSHRIDAWIAALSSARLSRMRAAQPAGISIGAFGWLLDIAPQKRQTPQGGYIAAPGIDLATTAGILRSAYLSHNPSDGGGGAFAIDLSSARVRRAMLLLQGVAQGQTLPALLGYDFERRMHEGNCDRFILSFRGLAPLIAGQMNAGGNAVERGIVAGVNVTDMLRLLEIWNDPGRGPGWLYPQLGLKPVGNEYLDPTINWTGPDDDQKAAIAAAMTQAAEDADALADLMLAEAVHQLAQGNMARASAALDAAGRGEAPPPQQLDVLETHGPGVVVTHRLIAVPPQSPSSWPGASPRAQCNPGAEGWAAARLGAPEHVPLGQGRNLADTGLSALDFAALCRHPETLERVLRHRAGLANPAAAFPTTVRPGEQTLAQAILTGAALQEVLDSAQPLGGLSIGLPGASGWLPDQSGLTAAFARLDGAAGGLQSRLLVLDRLLSNSAVLRDDMMAALLALTDFGFAFPDLGRSQLAELARLALIEGAARLQRANAERAKPPLPDTLAAYAEALFGTGFP
ncbi:hypothetical protein, partial [Paracoccus sp. (in: a-proteobacteria)]|uniref:hypothetical protein n=1 Tax=Paracoccus sp. TaxID=267 RepID=UPI00289BB9D1